jgi:hypothetical protein
VEVVVVVVVVLLAHDGMVLTKTTWRCNKWIKASCKSHKRWEQNVVFGTAAADIVVVVVVV